MEAVLGGLICVLEQVFSFANGVRSDPLRSWSYAVVKPPKAVLELELESPARAVHALNLHLSASFLI